MARRYMTYRVVPLASGEAGDSRLGASATERLEMLGRLSRMAWTAGGQELPRYTRKEMRVRLSTLADQGAPDDR